MAQTLKEVTVTGELKGKDGVLFCLEYRHDASDIPFFLKGGGHDTKQNTLTGGLTYAFSTQGSSADGVMRSCRSISAERPPEPKATGSNPVGRAIPFDSRHLIRFISYLAQWVYKRASPSVCVLCS